MEKKKRILPRLFAALVILTLVSCCFIGSTFARYTSSSTGSATVEVAKWDIDVKGGGVSNSTAITFNKLSPDKEAYVGEDYVEENVRTKSTAKVLVATITNNSEVNADVTFDVSDTATVLKRTIDGETDPEDYNDAVINEVITITFYKGNTTNVLADGEKVTLDTNSNKTLEIYAVVTWTSDDESVSGEDADKRDTYIGTWVESLTWTLSYTAVQASELPV